MQACTCFLLFGAFAYIHSSPVSKPTEDKRGANLTLKSIPELNVKETSKNVNVATNKTVDGVNNIPQPHSTVETFTDFLQELVIILNTYDDVIFEDFTDIVDKEIKKYSHNENVNENELQNEFQNLLAEESNLLMKKSVADKRAVINQIVDMLKLLKIFDTNVRELLDYINSLYRTDAKKKFQKILSDLKDYSAGYGNLRTKDNFARLIKECVRATVFIHRNLNTDVKLKLQKHIDTFMKKIKKFYPSTWTSSITNFVTFKSTISKLNTYAVKISDNIFTENITPKTSLKLNPTNTTPHIKEENNRIKIFTTDTNETKQEDAVIRHETSLKLNLTNTIPHMKEENKRIIVFRTDTSEVKQEDAAITTKTSLNLNPTTVHINEENNRIRIFRIRAEPKQEDATTKHETFERGVSNSQQKNITHSYTNETATEVTFFMTTENPGIVYKSESKSKLVEKMFEEKSTEKQVTGQSTTAPEKRSTTKKDLRRSEKPPLPGEELSVEIFDRDRRRQRKKTHTRSSKLTTELPALKEYLRRMRKLQKKLEELKSINKFNHYSKLYKDVENNAIDEHKRKDKKPSNKRKESKNFKKKKHSYEHEGKVQREKNKVDDTEKDIKQTNSVSKDKKVLGSGVEIKDEDIHHHPHKVIYKKKDRRSKSKKTTKATRYRDIESNGIDEHETKDNKPNNNLKESKKLKKSKHRYEHEAKVQREKNKPKDSEDDRQKNLMKVIHKKKDTRSKSKKTTKATESSTKPNKFYSKKKLVLRSSESLSTANDNAINKKHAKARLKTTKKVDNTGLYDSEEIKESIIDETATKGVIKENAVNKKHAKTKSKEIKKAETTDLNVSEEIKQRSIDETATKGIIKVMEDDMNETTTAQSIRRLVKAFPSLFEEHTLQGLYPAHLWD